MSLLGVSNVVSAGSSVSYIGDRAYAYSGVIAADNNATTYLDFTTGQGYMVARFQFCYGEPATDDYEYVVKLNNETMIQTISGGSTSVNTFDVFELIIPAETQVLCTARNVTDTSSLQMDVIMTGRVY